MAKFLFLPGFLLLGVTGEHRPLSPRPSGILSHRERDPAGLEKSNTACLCLGLLSASLSLPLFADQDPWLRSLSSGTTPFLPLTVLHPEPQVEWVAILIPLLPVSPSWQGLTVCIKLIVILVIRYNHSLPAGCCSSRRVWNYFLEFAI